MLHLGDPGFDLYHSIGTKIRSVRRAKRMTQLELAISLGMSRASIANIEGGHQRLTIDLLYDISDILGVESTSMLPRNHEV